MRIILGGYTDPEHQHGLKALELDESSGAISLVAEHKLSNALYQALSPDGKYLYSCTGEGLSSFCAEDLKPVDSLSLGNCVCHVSVIQEGQRVVFADYLGGFAGSVEVKDGKFGKVVKHQHSGSGPNLPRQDNAHCHQAVALPDGSGYCAVDLGLDELVEYPPGASSTRRLKVPARAICCFTPTDAWRSLSTNSATSSRRCHGLQLKVLRCLTRIQRWQIPLIPQFPILQTSRPPSASHPT